MIRSRSRHRALRSLGCVLFGQAGLDPPSDWVVAASQKVRVMSVEAFHANPGASDASAWAMALVVVGNEFVSFVSVGVVGSLQGISIDSSFRLAYSPG